MIDRWPSGWVVSWLPGIARWDVLGHGRTSPEGVLCALPEVDGHRRRAELEVPRAHHQGQVPSWTTSPLSECLSKLGPHARAVPDLRSLLGLDFTHSSRSTRSRPPHWRSNRP